jgi:hypothetical protein
MPRRRLGVLINLGEHASHNQAHTIKRKVVKGASVPIPIPKGREYNLILNHLLVCPIHVMFVAAGGLPLFVLGMLSARQRPNGR